MSDATPVPTDAPSPAARFSWGRALPIWIVGAVLAVAANSWISYRSVRRLVVNESAVAQARDTVIALEDVLSTIKDAETGQRGFIITNDPKYLEPYNEALATIAADLNRLQTLAGSSSALQIKAIKFHLDAKLRELSRSLLVRRMLGFNVARGYIQSERGRIAMDELRRLIGEIEASERIELARLSEESSLSASAALATVAGAGAVNLILLAVVVFVANRYTRQREAAAAENLRSTALQTFNDQLNAEVRERIRAEETQRLLAARLQVSNRELQDFASVASHDLQEPLRKVQAFGDRLRARCAAGLGADGLDYLGRMQAAAARMQTLIDDLLTFSRVTSKAQPFVPTDLRRITSEVLIDLETRIEQSGGSVQVGALPVVDADPLQMRQLLQNLIANALKFARPGVPPQVVVEQQTPAPGIEPNGMITILVRDNGIGFDEKYLDRIFTVFQRLHGRGIYEGTGIGLAVCRKIVERHHGTITARSTPGEGATFLMTLPVHQQEVDLPAVAEPAGAQPTTET